MSQYTVDDPKLGKVYVSEGENSMAMSNQPFGGWQKTKDGSYISDAAVRLMNRKERRKRGVKR